MVLVAAFGLGIFGLMKITPTGFLPEEDQGAFFINVQLPDGASVNRTSEAVKQVEDVLKTMPQVQDTMAIIGFSLLDSYSASNNAFVLAKLKPFEDRTKAADSAQALIAQVVRCGPADPHRGCAAVQPPAGGGTFDDRRLRISA